MLRGGGQGRWGTPGVVSGMGKVNCQGLLHKSMGAPGVVSGMGKLRV